MFFFTISIEHEIINICTDCQDWKDQKEGMEENGHQGKYCTAGSEMYSNMLFFFTFYCRFTEYF